MNSTQEVLAVKDLSVWYPIPQGFLGRVQSYVKAVRHFDLTVNRGEIVAVVGESGCGKTTLASALVGLRAWQSGELFLAGEKLDPNDAKTWQRLRTNVQMVFQDPYGSLNPRQTLYEILLRPLRANGISLAEGKLRVLTALQQVGLAESDLEKFPHAFSGGQRQRIGIARALALRSKVLVCDEPTSALDVSVQAQILQLLQKLRKELGLSIILISHDLAVVRALADRVVVMYLGSVVETIPAEQLFTRARHPYSQALLASVPTLNSRKAPQMLAGEIPSLTQLLSGCVFASRCPQVRPECSLSEPLLQELSEGCSVRCPWTQDLR